MPRTRLARIICLSSYFGLICLMTVWYAWIAPPQHFPVSLMLLIVVLPLLLGIRGILHERLYTHAWISLLALAYLAHGAVESYSSPDTRYLAIAEILLSIGLTLGAGFYVRFRAADLRNQADS